MKLIIWILFISRFYLMGHDTHIESLIDSIGFYVLFAKWEKEKKRKPAWKFPPNEKED